MDTIFFPSRARGEVYVAKLREAIRIGYPLVDAREYAEREAAKDEPEGERCEGCDDLRDDVADYIGYFGDSESSRWERVRYCSGCYDLALANWNGETLGIAPTSGDRTGEDFNARVRAAAARMRL